jgi:ABC-type dipeptide/oligopeptide/nickel transport system permease component
MRRFPKTLELTLAAMLIAFPLGITLGVIAATAKYKVVDSVTMVTALAGLSIPSFYLAIILILIFGLRLNWVNVTGGEGLKSLILPAFCLAIGSAAVLARLTRSCILEVVREDYVRTARAKGVGERTINVRHVLRNALIPVVTVMGMQFAGMLTGTMFIEAVFARPGLGRFAIGAINARDYPQVQGMVLFTATVVVVVNLAVDVLYGILDPRIRFG